MSRARAAGVAKVDATAAARQTGVGPIAAVHNSAQKTRNAALRTLLGNWAVSYFATATYSRTSFNL